MVIAQTNFEDLNIDLGTRNAFRRNFANLNAVMRVEDAREIIERRGIGLVKLMDFCRALLRVYIVPKWFFLAVEHFEYSTVAQDDWTLEAAGFYLMAGPYYQRENWMLERVMADLERGQRNYRLQRLHENGPIYVWLHGCALPVEPETEEAAP